MVDFWQSRVFYFILGVFGGIVGVRVYDDHQKKQRALRAGQPAKVVCAPGSGKKLACPPSPPAAVNPSAPMAGRASALAHQWCHEVKEGDTPGKIAEKYVGRRDRYIELIAANPTKPRVVVKLPDGTREENFEDICIGERLFLPRTWNPWVDETGALRGQKVAFPPYDKMPEYPGLPKDVFVAGYLPWPPLAPTGWQPIPFEVAKKAA